MYSSFVLAFGFVYILYYFKENFIYLGVAVAISLMFINILGINSYIKPKYFLNEDVKLLNELKIKQNDSLISWWDYGWPLWYYTGNRNTYIDNGLNTFGGTVFVSKMLLSPPQEAYKLAKIISTNTRDLSILKSQESIDNKFNSITESKYIYIMLHKNMLGTIKSIAKFGDRDLASGKLLKSRMVESLSNIIKRSQGKLYTMNFIIDTNIGLIIDKKSNKAKLNQIIVIKNKKIISSKTYDINKKRNIIIVDNRVIYLDNKTVDGLLIDKLLLNKTDKYFKEVKQSKNIRILKLN